jgi:amidase
MWEPAMHVNRRLFLSGAGLAALSACASRLPGGATGGPPDAVATLEMLRTGKMSATEAVEAAIRRAQAAQPRLNFMVSDRFAEARAEASSTAKAGAPLLGLPFLTKDLNDVAGMTTRSGSGSTRGARPATKDDSFIAGVHAAGAITIAKTASPEFGYLPTTEPLAFGPTRNPWNTAHSSGGSSGGAAAAVAAGVVPVAHANDGGGSIRFPACNCGLFGLKPSRDRMRTGAPYAQPLGLGVEGFVSRTVRDSALFLSLVEERSAGAPLAPMGLVSAPLARKLKVGVLTRTFQGLEADPEVVKATRDAVLLLQGMGHSVEETKWPVDPGFPDDFLALWSLGALADAGAAAERLGRAPGPADLEPFSLTMAENARKLSGPEIGAVQGRLIAASNAYSAWIKGFDVVVSPVIAHAARPLGYFRGDVPFPELRERLLTDVGYTLIHNVSGAPAMSLPLGWSKDGLPIGVQVSAAVGADRLLLELALQLEAAAPWTGRRPQVWVG